MNWWISLAMVAVLLATMGLLVARDLVLLRQKEWIESQGVLTTVERVLLRWPTLSFSQSSMRPLTEPGPGSISLDSGPEPGRFGEQPLQHAPCQSFGC